jgi:hypothetical protein
MEHVTLRSIPPATGVDGIAAQSKVLAELRNQRVGAQLRANAATANNDSILPVTGGPQNQASFTNAPVSSEGGGVQDVRQLVEELRRNLIAIREDQRPRPSYEL